MNGKRLMRCQRLLRVIESDKPSSPELGLGKLRELFQSFQIPEMQAPTLPQFNRNRDSWFGVIRAMDGLFWNILMYQELRSESHQAHYEHESVEGGMQRHALVIRFLPVFFEKRKLILRQIEALQSLPMGFLEAANIRIEEGSLDRPYWCVHINDPVILQGGNFTEAEKAELLGMPPRRERTKAEHKADFLETAERVKGEYMRRLTRRGLPLTPGLGVDE